MNRLSFLVVIAALVAGACAPAAPAPAVSAAAPEKAQITSTTTSELEGVLQKRAAAMARRDQAGFLVTIDQSRPAFKRCLSEAFDIATRQGGSTPTRILKLEPYGDTYVRAYVDEGTLGVGRRYFRREQGQWVQTEPKNTELGGEKKKTVSGLQAEYWGVDDDVIDVLANEGLATLEFLKKHAPPKQTSIVFAMRVYPTRESVGIFARCTALATSGDRNDPVVRFYGVWLSPSLKEVSTDMRDTFQHEGLHNLQEQFSPGIFARLSANSWWLIEGWPDHVAGPHKRDSRLKTILCGGSGFSFKQVSDGPPTDDPTLPPEVPGQMYAYAAGMIDYLLQTYGTEAYWTLVGAHVESVDPKIVYPKALKISGDQLFADWQAWAKKRYC